jgi:hypothetical protein
MVLVDSSNPASAANPQAASPAAAVSYDVMGLVSAMVSTSARLGLGRLYSQFAFGTLPPRRRADVSASTSTANNLRGTIDEFVRSRQPVAGR